MVRTPWCSIIIPTLSDNPPTLKSLPPPGELERLGIELIVTRDMGWRNASRTRNMGAMRARGEVLCFIDDDASLNFHKLLDLLRRVSERERVRMVRSTTSSHSKVRHFHIGWRL
jgi:glycosyltransferase involved in cell wall biosynthesis